MRSKAEEVLQHASVTLTGLETHPTIHCTLPSGWRREVHTPQSAARLPCPILRHFHAMKVVNFDHQYTKSTDAKKINRQGSQSPKIVKLKFL